MRTLWSPPHNSLGEEVAYCDDKKKNWQVNMLDHLLKQLPIGRVQSMAATEMEDATQWMTEDCEEPDLNKEDEDTMESPTQLFGGGSCLLR